MVAITVVASHALLELDMGQMRDQLRENSSAYIHPPLFRPTPECPPRPIWDRFSSNRFFEEGYLYH